MLQRRVKVQIGVFVLIALLAVSFIAVRYVGLLRYFGATGYTVSVQLPDSGGLFTNAEVTYRGVPVGRVGAMRLTATGIVADLTISSSSTKIPRDVRANVADRSIIGEQYIDLVPQSDDAPYLTAGAVIPASSTTTPVTANQLLESTNTLLSSIPIGSLQTTVTELSAAFRTATPDLARLLDSSSSFFSAAQANFPDQSALLDTSATVLSTQEATSQSIVDFSSNLRLIAANLQSSDGQLRTLISVTPGAATTVNGLFTDLSSTLGLLLSNLTTTSEVFDANIGGLQTLLVRAPQAITVGNKVVTAQGAHVGLALTFFDPLPCTTGYGGTVRRSPTATTDAALNTAAGCAQAEPNAPRVVAASGPSYLASIERATAGTTPDATLADLMGGSR